ncbi:MAG TPA: SpoVR family protein [Candidatus Binatia bacterium]
MSAVYNLEDLERWNELIVALVERFGLDTYPQEFEVCDHEDMLSYMVYSGMPSHYPHWSYGKGFEKLKTLYEYGVSGLPYEMVINSNPAIAYLMRDNSLALQILTIAHVYGHNDFFKNNFTFRSTRAEYTIETFKTHADRVRRYVEDPSIGLEKVERILDAAHALSLQCRRNLAIRKQGAEEQREAKLQESQPAKDPFSAIHRTKEYAPPDLTRVPLYPDEDILLFIRDHNPHFADWEKDLLTIVNDQAQYFIPQMETKIMNEGWASFWHKRILEALDLPQSLHLEFIVRHTQVLRPHPGGLNPYHVGMKIWEDIEKRWDHPTPEEEKEFGPRTKSGIEKLFEVREVERDSSFLRRYLTEDLLRELNLFEYRTRGDEQVVSRVADKDSWRDIKETLIQNVGTGTIPVIKVVDSDYNKNRALLLHHEHDGRDLQLEYAEKTLRYMRQLWEHDVALKTVINEKPTLLTFADDKLSIKPA